MAVSELPKWGKTTMKHRVGTPGFRVGFGKSNRSVVTATDHRCYLPALPRGGLHVAGEWELQDMTDLM